MELIEAIKARHSVREYTDRPIELEKLAELRVAIEKANQESGLDIQLVTEEPKAFSGLFISTYGQFSGVSNYIVMAARKGKQWEEKVGYYGEHLALLAPTAVNQQKFKFILHSGNTVEAKALFSMIGYTYVDLGIAKYHFEIGAGMEHFNWI